VEKEVGKQPRRRIPVTTRLARAEQTSKGNAAKKAHGTSSTAQHSTGLAGHQPFLSVLFRCAVLRYAAAASRQKRERGEREAETDGQGLACDRSMAGQGAPGLSCPAIAYQLVRLSLQNHSRI